MKIFVLKNDYVDRDILAYIFYYTKKKEWYIELADDVDEWDLPFILEHFARHGQKTIDAYWSREFVRARIVPTDRQNLGTILKDNHLDEYDEFQLFTIADGRCSQDECYIERITIASLPSYIKERQHLSITSTTITDDGLMITLKNDDVYHISLEKITKDYEWMKRILFYADRLHSIHADCSGKYIVWQDHRSLPIDYILHHGTKLPISATVLKNFASNAIISTTEATEILNCSRQNLNDLVKRGRLNPVAIKSPTTLYYKEDIISLSYDI